MLFILLFPVFIMKGNWEPLYYNLLKWDKIMPQFRFIAQVNVCMLLFISLIIC